MSLPDFIFRPRGAPLATPDAAGPYAFYIYTFSGIKINSPGFYDPIPAAANWAIVKAVSNVDPLSQASFGFRLDGAEGETEFKSGIPRSKTRTTAMAVRSCSPTANRSTTSCSTTCPAVHCVCSTGPAQ